MDAQDLGRFAKEQRREAGLSQQDVTLLADVSERFVRAFESGTGSVHLDKASVVLPAEAIADAAGFDPRRRRDLIRVLAYRRRLWGA